MRITLWLCNNSEIHLCLWKVWSLVVCSQSSFYVTRARKDDKNRQNTFFLRSKKMKLVSNKQLLLNVPFQSTKYRKKELCVDNKVQENLGDVYCPICRNEKCVHSSTNKTTIFYDCKKCKVCCQILNIAFKAKNRELCCLAVTVHIALQERRVATTKKKSHLDF